MAISTIILTIEVPLPRDLLCIARELEACPEPLVKLPSTSFRTGGINFVEGPGENGVEEIAALA